MSRPSSRLYDVWRRWYDEPLVIPITPFVGCDVFITGLHVRVTRLLGVFSSLRYPHANYPFKGRVFCHLLFQAEIVGGGPAPRTEETSAIGWFSESEVPPLSDGHVPRIRVGFELLRDDAAPPHFE